MSETLEKMIEAAKAGGTVLRHYFGQSLETIEKTSAADFKTRADIESEKAILAILLKYFPDYNIISEEDGTTDKKSEYTFIIDPLDGTNNFVLGIPNFTVSIGLFKGDRIVCGVIYAPLIDCVYSAEEDAGAFCNGVKLKVNQEENISKATISHMCDYNGDEDKKARIVAYLKGLKVKRVTENWSVAFDYCLLASGRMEGIITDGNELHDFTAGKIIAREAGAIFVNFDGSPEVNDKNRVFIASNNIEIQKVLIDTLKKI
jgi:myo-inositol-1(or 4)-monophosphatase